MRGAGVSNFLSIIDPFVHSLLFVLYGRLLVIVVIVIIVSLRGPLVPLSVPIPPARLPSAVRAVELQRRCNSL